ncbi:MAG TPA: amino acid adenylation domain-containing protein, partial [Longimicrobiaceae bacterium]
QETRGFALHPQLAAELREMARSEGVTPFVLFLGAFQALLARWSGQEDVSVGTPVAGRNRLETEGLIGFFVNTLVLRVRLDGDPTLRAVVHRARDATLGAFGHQDVPFEKLVEELQPERSLRHTPFFQVMFSLQAKDEDREVKLGTLEVESLSRGREVAKFDLTISMVDDSGGFGAAISYRTELFDESTVQRMANHFRNLLGALATHPDRPLWEVELMGPEERTQVLEEWNATERPYPAGSRVHDLFAAQAARTPAAPAVFHRGETMSYAELERRSARLANALRRRGVGPESRVGVCMSRTPELLVALLAVLRAGGAYVPLDPAYPRERLGYMVEDAGIGLVLTEPGLVDRLPENGAAPLFADAASGEPDAAPESGVLPENLSHVIFTSGSTGRPKGVMIRHSSTVVLLHWLRENVPDEERSSVLFSTSINFDVSVAEIFGTLCWGGKLVLVENALELATVEEPVVYASMVPSAAVELLRTGGIPASVRTLNLAGEALPGPLAQGLYALPTVDKVRNLYGPTEDTTYSTYSLVERGGEQVYIGRPLAKTRAYVLDARLKPVPVGIVGELYLAGDGLARGYEGRPDLTADRFLPDPFGAPGARMYRVMDRVRWRDDGVLEYFGRTDFQVKVRGFRIELGEIEAVLGRHPSVRDVVAVVREDAPGDRRIVAYVTGTGASPAELRVHVAAHLPDYMVPSAVIVLDAFPLSPNGKVDRKALPVPGAVDPAEAYVAPRTPTEEILAGIYAEVLRRERVGIADGFFAMGGHSLLATQVISRVQAALGVEVPLRALFEAPTVAALAERVDESLRTVAGVRVPPLLPVPRNGPLPLSFAQQRLWFIDQLEPGSPAYNMPFPLRLRGALDVRALERALTELVRRHESLRTVLARVDGEPVQVIREPAPRVLPVADLSALPAEARGREAHRLAVEDARRPFDLSRGPLLRAALARLADDDSLLLVNLHHVVSDGWSMGVLVREVSALYGAFSRGEPSPLPELPVQYADYAAWQRAWLTGETLERQIGYWKERLGGAPPLLELPTDHPRPAVAGLHGGARGFALPEEASRALRSL